MPTSNLWRDGWWSTGQRGAGNVYVGDPIGFIVDVDYPQGHIYTEEIYARDVFGSPWMGYQQSGTPYWWIDQHRAEGQVGVENRRLWINDG